MELVALKSDVGVFLSELKEIKPVAKDDALQKKQELLTIMTDCPYAEHVNFDAFSIGDLEGLMCDIYEVADTQEDGNNEISLIQNPVINGMMVTRLVTTIRNMPGKIYMEDDLDMF